MGADALPPWQPAGGSARGEREPRILVAEDDPSVREFVSQILTMEGYRVTCVVDGIRAIEKIQQAERMFMQFDLLITDIAMPGMSGIDLVTEMKNLHIQIPVLVISGHLTRKDFLKLRVKGCEHFLIKSFSDKTITQRVKTILNKKVDP